jgi:hypothetical protein
MAENTIIVVNKEPYCIWEVDLKNRNLEFLNSVNPEYFEYLIRVHFEKVEENDDKWASVALRIGYFQALETLFSLIGAFLQAPDCAYAWISKCSIGELRELISRINKSDQAIFTKLNIKHINWESISNSVFRFYLPKTEKNTRTSKCFANLWQRLSYEFLNKDNINEYNSLKHGFRIKPGGFGLRVGLEHEEGVSPPEEEMQTVGFSKYGTTFYNLERIGSLSNTNRSFRSRRVSINWRIENVALLLQLIAMSIQNIVSIIKIANGISPSNVKFYRTSEDADFEKPWTFSPGITNMSMDHLIEESHCKPLTKRELLNILKDKKK